MELHRISSIEERTRYDFEHGVDNSYFVLLNSKKAAYRAAIDARYEMIRSHIYRSVYGNVSTSNYPYSIRAYQLGFNNGPPDVKVWFYSAKSMPEDIVKLASCVFVPDDMYDDIFSRFAESYQLEEKYVSLDWFVQNIYRKRRKKTEKKKKIDTLALDEFFDSFV